MELQEEDIDTSDIPEVRELPEDAARGNLFRGRTVSLNEDLHAYFSASAARKGVS